MVVDIWNIKKQGVVSEMFIRGEIPDDLMTVYCQAVESYKNKTGKTIKEWYNEPKKHKLSYV